MYFKLFLEFDRILGEADVKKTMSLAWENIWSVKIISLAKREQHRHGIKCLLDLYFPPKQSEIVGN